MLARDVMTCNPLSCTQLCTAQIAAAMMQESGSGFIPVLEKFTRKLLGVVTDRDLCLGVVAAGRDPKRVLVAECMSENPVYCRSADEIGFVLALMKEYQVRRILVLDENNEPEGVISIGDLLRCPGAHSTDVYEALKAICAPSKAVSKVAAKAECIGL
jgi:CBS domain-containing protein